MTLKVGILGFGGLGQAAAKLLSAKQEMQLVVAADKEGFAYDRNGLNASDAIAAYQTKGSLGYLEGSGILTQDSITQAIATAKDVDGYFLALPNLPNTFMASVAKQFIDSGWQGVLVDALKRTSAMEQMIALAPELKPQGSPIYLAVVQLLGY